MSSGLGSIFLVIAPIALVDSTSITPLCIVPLIMLLSDEQPILRASAFLLGIFSSYLAGSLLLLFGLERVFDRMNQVVSEFLRNPGTTALVVQIGIGLAMLLFATRMANAREAREERRPQESISARQAFTGGAVLTIVGLPGALPLFAAIDQILRADPSSLQKVLALTFYNLVFILPLFSAVVARVLLGEKSVPMLKRVNEVVSRLARKALIWGLIGLGVALIADGIGWLLGHPLLPVPGD